MHQLKIFLAFEIYAMKFPTLSHLANTYGQKMHPGQKFYDCPCMDADPYVGKLHNSLNSAIKSC